MARLERTFAPDHPAAQGHFPGNPVIPGALLLSETVQAVAAALEIELSQCRIGTAKFLSAARPGDRVTIEFAVSRPDRAEFVCSVAGRTVLTGNVTWGATTTRG